MVEKTLKQDEIGADPGSGDGVQLDYISDPVRLPVGGKIAVRGELVPVSGSLGGNFGGSFGLRATGVAEPRQRLESIPCLF